ncbi:hypothetical protein BDY19DRAFT_13429 [Irpex rosettiformis]|uniref:Uncharacterized protein n=1 Tax=Irpex rosettiformis TaxID=378272 RepID=A0ACB8UIV6_9APHY|nr:hypothetical protein BDY19DRAFT_13429 [Irpex rosettiformis]
MLPPSMIPRRLSSQLSSADSDGAHIAMDDIPTTPIALNTRNSHSTASPISVPSRHSARPPAIQSFTASRSSTPVPPRIHSGTHSGDPISIPTPISTPSRTTPAPRLVGQPSRTDAGSVQSNPSSKTQAPIPTLVSPPAEIGVPISDAQIDPALLQAITTVLQNANQSESQATASQQEVSSSTQVSDEVDSQTRPTSRGKRRSKSKQNADSAGPSTSNDATPRLQRAVRPSSNTEGTLVEEQSVEDRELSPKSRRRKRTSTGSSTPRKRQSRAPSVPPFDPEADPGEELDPTAVTMAELCDDTGRGRVSSKAAQIVTNHAAWRATNREKRARMRAMMEAKKYGREGEEEGAAPTGDTETAEPPSKGESGSQPAPEPLSSRAHSPEAEQTEGQRGDDFDYSQAVSTSRYNVQVRIGPNGETIIDETSLYVDRHEEEETVNYTHVEESDTTKFVNSMSYSKKLRGSRWSAEETDLFFDALSQFGENYELISYVLPGRDRKACKNKFKVEDKRNPNRITFCLKNRRPYDMQTLARMTGKDFSGPPPEIIIPAPPRTPQNVEPHTEDESAPTIKVRKQSATPGLEGGEVVEVIEDYDAEHILA